jgi:hypothetical protein
VGLKQEKNYDGTTRGADHCVCFEHADWFGHGQSANDWHRYRGRLIPAVGAVMWLISSQGLFASALISVLYSFYDPDPVYLFYALLFCALGIFMEGYERGSR